MTAVASLERTPVPGSGSTAGVFLSARWERLAMLNYEIDPASLRSRAPRGTELDTWGRCFVSMVGFLFLDTRVLGVPIPLHRDFEEVNLRFYVRRRAADGDRRGVVFVKELVPRWAIAAVAKVVYNENYEALPMRHRIEWPTAPDASRDVEYGWRRGDRWNRLRVVTEGPASIPAAGSEEEFITEHYWGYAAQRDGGCVEYKVEHPQWRVWRGARAELDCDVERLYGREFADVLAGKPSSAFVAEGSPIVVRRGVRLPS